MLRESLAAGGTSFDALYVNVGESPLARLPNAYGRAGGPPPLRGGGPHILIVRTFQNRSSYRCPHCQRARARQVEGSR